MKNTKQRTNSKFSSYKITFSSSSMNRNKYFKTNFYVFYVLIFIIVYINCIKYKPTVFSLMGGPECPHKKKKTWNLRKLGKLGERK